MADVKVSTREKWHMKRKFYFWAKKYVNSDNVKLAFMFVPLIIILMQQIRAKEFDLSSIFDVGILTTFLILVLSDFITGIIQKKVAENTEDHAKVTDDYKALIKKYSCTELVQYQGVTYPEECLCIRKPGEKIEICDSSEKYYRLPAQIACNSKELMGAHRAAVVYNQINIRLDRLEQGDNKIVLHTSRTQYFDSLITNRSCDYIFGDREVTAREIYEPGPFLKPLHLSKMSNHLGFNGFVITKEGKIPFIFRKKNLSIAKNLWSPSIAASLKAKYALYGKEHEMQAESLGTAIICEIKDELNISEDRALVSEKAQQSIFAFYRDLVEAGKPQFLFCLQLEDITAEQVRAAIENEDKEKKKGVTTDGDKVEFFTIEQLKQAKLSVDRMEVNGKEYRMMPSSMVSVVLLLQTISD